MDRGLQKATQNEWLLQNGPKELELLLRAVVYYPSSPILIADNDGKSREVSTGAGKLAGLPREKLIGRPIDELATPSSRPQLSELWRAFLENGVGEGVLPLATPDGTVREIAYSPAKTFCL